MQPPLANVFQPLINVFEAILKVFHDHVGLGWGLAIIALTVLIRSLLLPLTLKQLRSMYRMAQFTPQIKKLRDKHGSDPQRLQRETLAFYKENRINPLGSVLPALAQLPVFLSLYYMLRTDLRHDICPGINPPGTPNPQPCGETAASHFLFIPSGWKRVLAHCCFFLRRLRNAVRGLPVRSYAVMTNTLSGSGSGT